MGNFYTGGSRCFDEYGFECTRLGWAFVLVDDAGHVIASANGVPPPWVTDIPASEAWALLQAASVAHPSARYISDCKTVVDTLHGPMADATAASRPLARVFNLLFPAMDDTPRENIVWMPAHTSAANVGQLKLSNGCLLTPSTGP